MRRCILILLSAALWDTGPQVARAVSSDHPEDLVQVLAGTDQNNPWDPSTGNTLPQIKTPWGFNDWVPQTNSDPGAWWFRRDDDAFQGVRCTHQPSPWIGDYAHFLLQPHIEDKPRDLKWDPDSEQTTWHPYLFSAALEDIQLELVPTSHAAILQLKFPQTANASHLSLIVEEGVDRGLWSSEVSADESSMSIRGRTSINEGGVPEGWHGMYFVAKALTKARTVYESKGGSRYKPMKLGTFEFELSDQPVLIAVATSFVSQDQADLNLKQELGSKSFQDLLAETRAKWAEQLGRVRAEAIDDEQLEVFYTNLWKSMLFPRFLQEVDINGQEVHYSPYTDKVQEGKLVADSGFWDSYLTVYPLQSIIYSDNLGKTIDGWIKAYKEATWLPQWASPGQRDCMVGTMSDVVLADAIAKSKWGFLSGFDVDEAYEAIRKDAFREPQVQGFGRNGLQEYIEQGYVSNTIDNSVSRSLNYYVSDAAIARAAGILGKSDDERTLRARSKKYGTLFNEHSHFFEPKSRYGDFKPDFNPRSWEAFTEASAWQYRFYVPHDVEGLQKLYKGQLCQAIQEMMSFRSEPAVEDMDGQAPHEMREMMSIQPMFGLYAHNNQPAHHILYVAKKAGCNALADKYIRKVMRLLYTPDGWPGDEDNGEMASWYVLSALGIYQLEGAKDEIVLGSPALARASVQLPKGKTLTVIAQNQGHENVHVDSVTWTAEAGQPRTITNNVLKFTELMRGGTLNFVMSPTPKPPALLRGAKRH